LMDGRTTPEDFLVAIQTEWDDFHEVS